MSDVLAPRLLTVAQAARLLGIGRTKGYELIDAGELEVVHIGRAARVPVDSVDDYVEPPSVAILSPSAGRCRPRLTFASRRFAGHLPLPQHRPADVATPTAPAGRSWRSRRSRRRRQDA